MTESLSVPDPDTLTRGEWTALAADAVAPRPTPLRSPALAAVAEALTDRPDWHRLANCRGLGTEWFFRSKGESQTEAQRVCDGCVVREPCLEAGLGEFGVWGGVSERQRKRISSQRRRQRRAGSGMREAS
jgi:WhiB family transcriptional regulator, redox-sensing transcriptional regulator